MTRPLNLAPPAIVRVRCGGQLHRIAYDRGAADVRPLDHDAADLAQFAAPGPVGNACRCAEVFRAFRARAAQLVPPRLRRLMPLPPPELRQVTSRLLPHDGPDVEAVGAGILAAVAGGNYPRTVSRWAGGRCYVEVTLIHPTAACFASGYGPSPPERYSVLQVHVHLDWLTRIRDAGLALIPLQGRPHHQVLVLDVLHAEPLTVLAVRPGGGGQAQPWPALVAGEPHRARWLAPAPGRALLEAYRQPTP